MANLIRLKRASGSDPTASDLVAGEPAVRTDTGELFFKKDDGSIAKVAGAGGGPDFKYLALRNAANNGAASYPNADFTLVRSGTTTALVPTAANTLLVSVNGVIQKPNTGTSTPSQGFALSGSTIKFGANLSAAPDFILYQESGGIGEPSDETVSEEKLKVSNSPVNGYFLSAQSGNTGGLTWAAPVATSCTGNSATATALATARTINGTSFDGTSNITVTAAAGTLTGNTLNSSVTASSLTSLGDLSGLTVSASNPQIVVQDSDGTNQTTQLIQSSGAFFIDVRNDSNNGTFLVRGKGGGTASEYLRIDGSGRLLLGTTTEGRSTGDKFTIATNGHTGMTIRSGTSAGGNIFFSDGTSGDDELRGVVSYDHTNNFMRFYTNAAERFRIDSSGRVGIGCTPTAQFAHNILQIGNQATLGANAALSTTGQTYLTHNLYFDTSGNYQVFNTSSPNEGAILQLADGSFRFSNSAVTTGTPTVTERMRITSGGNVNIASSSTRLGQTTFKAQIETATNKLISFGETEGSSFSDQGAAVIFSRPQDGADKICALFQHTNQSLGIAARDNFTISTGGNAFYYSTTERLRIDSSGNVGIGTSSPDQKLQVEGSGSQYVAITSTNSDNTGVLFGDSDIDAGFVLYANSDNSLRFATNGANERMRITGDGPHLLLGGTSDVNEITESSANAGMVIGGTGFGNAGLAIITSTSGVGRLYFGDAVGGDAARNRGQINYDHSDDRMRFATAGTERMRIDNSGNVGIGTTSPAEKLDVTGSIGVTVGLKVASHPVVGYASTLSSYATRLGSTGTSTLRYTQIYGGGNLIATCDGVSGYVGIGTTNPGTHLEVKGTTDGVLNLDTTDGRGSFIRFKENGTSKCFVGCAEGLGLGDQDDLGLRATDHIIFRAGSSESMRIHTSGHLSVGTTNTSPGQGNGNTDVGAAVNSTGRFICNSAGSFSSFGRNQSGLVLSFTRQGGDQGGISVGVGSVSYGSGSDYRLKENVVSLTGAITRIKQLLPKRFNFIEDETNTLRDGFLAHEVSSIVPEAITGTKDEVDSDNNPVYQQIDQAKLVPLLVAALQEAIGRIEVLEAR